MVVVRHHSIDLIKRMKEYSSIPVINAMTDVDHPCEVVSDLYSLSKIRSDYLSAKYLFCGKKGNIGFAWKELAEVMNLDFTQCCPSGYEMENVKVEHDLRAAVCGKDIICTDSMPKDILPDFEGYMITKEIIGKANKGALLNPCPPFYRGEEVSSDVINSRYFVGYEFKKCLLEIQQAVMIYCMM